jgi:hypothetical protein
MNTLVEKIDKQEETLHKRIDFFPEECCCYEEDWEYNLPKQERPKELRVYGNYWEDY